VAIRLLPPYGKGVEVMTSAEVDSPAVLDSEVSGQFLRYESVLRACAAVKFIACADGWAI
jgi:hypothetical protein